MQFGVQFFPDVRPAEKPAEAYFREALDLAEDADRLGYSHVRIVEHYFNTMGFAPALASMRLFAQEVMPRFAAAAS